MIKVYVFLGLLLCEQICCKTCDDCMDYTSCPAAEDAISGDDDAGTPQQFLDRFCGVRYVNGDRIPKICCSDFSLPGGTVTHPNFSLLPSSCGLINVEQESRVVQLYEFPWIALLSSKTRHGNKFVCDGLIISSRYVITTAACTEVLGLSHVRVGDLNPNTAFDCQSQASANCEAHIQDIPIAEIKRHSGYIKTPLVRNNIALLRLSETIDFSFRNAAPICLPIFPDLRAYSLVGKSGTVVGWLHKGIYETRDYSLPIKLQKDVKPTNTCSAALSRLPRTNASLLDNEFCVFSRDDGLCNTVAGDPFMIINKYKQTNRYILYGIFSHGTQECIGNTPEVFVDIAKMADWILDNIS